MVQLLQLCLQLRDLFGHVGWSQERFLADEASVAPGLCKQGISRIDGETNAKQGKDINLYTDSDA
jgi:hypothetical protein